MTPPHGMRIVTSEHVPSGVALLIPDGGGIVSGPLTLDLPLWPHDGPFWAQSAADAVIASAATREALRAEDDLARVVDAAWRALGWDPALWRRQRAAETRAAQDMHRFRQAVLWAAPVLDPSVGCKVITSI